MHGDSIFPLYAPATPAGWKSGYYVTCDGTGGTAAPGAGNLMVRPIVVPPSGATIGRLSIEVTSSAAGSTVIPCIYSSGSNGLPASLVDQGSALDATSTGVKEATVSITLAGGVYWLGAVAQGGNPTLRSVAGRLAGIQLQSTAAFASNNSGVYQTSVTGSLPATFTAAPGADTSTCPAVFMRVA